MSISATHSPIKRMRRRTKNSTITIMDIYNDHGEQGEEEDDQLGDLYLRREPGRKLGNLYD